MSLGRRHVLKSARMTTQQKGVKELWSLLQWALAAQTNPSVVRPLKRLPHFSRE